MLNLIIQWIYIIGYKLGLCFWRVFKPLSTGVYIAVWCKNRVLLIKNSYKNDYTLPCGGIKKGERLNIAAARELFEEVNIKVNPDELKFVGAYSNPHEYKRDTINLFEIRFQSEPAFQVDNREVIWASFIDSADVMHFRLFPTVRTYLQNYLRNAN
jgi:8-oxo-dGTP pyrophosphatase MutT (NUDIX family)